MPVYSHSRLGTFENCPLQYKFSYINNIKRDRESIEAFLGNRVHEVLLILYRDYRFRPHSLEEIVKIYYEHWDRNWHARVFITKPDRTPDDYKKLGQLFIEDYYKRYAPFNQSSVLGLERSIWIRLDEGGKYKVRGIIDRLAQDGDGVYEIHDYKTSNYLPEQKNLDEDRQLGLYQIGVQDAWPSVKEIRLIWHFLAFDTEMVSYRTQEQLGRLKTDTIELINQIENTTDFPPIESALCEWCDYPDLCPKRKHLFILEGLPEEKQHEDDGVKLVDTYIELGEKKKELETEIEILKESIGKYAKKEGIETIIGSTHKVRINFKQEEKVPKKGDKERQELEKLIKGEGLWSKVSELDIHALLRGLKGTQFDPSVAEEIRKYLKTEETIAIHKAKLKEKEK